jgi:hypothetical protein
MRLPRLLLAALLSVATFPTVAADADAPTLRQFCGMEKSAAFAPFLDWDCETTTPKDLAALEAGIGPAFRKVFERPNMRAYMSDPAKGFVGWVVTGTWAVRYRARRDATGVTIGGGVTMFCADTAEVCAGYARFVTEDVPPQFAAELIPEPPQPPPPVQP